MSLILPAFSSPDLKVFLLLKKSFKSSAGGQGLVAFPVCAQLLRICSQPERPAARLCDLFRSAVATLHKSHRLAIVRIKVVGAEVLSDCRARAGKTVISRFNPCASGSCRALWACPLWHLPSVSTSAVADAKTVVKHHRPKRADGRFRVGASITVVPRPEDLPATYIYTYKPWRNTL